MNDDTTDRDTGHDDIELDVPLPEFWVAHQFDDDSMAAAEAEFVSMLEGQVEDPVAVAEASIKEFMARMGGGGIPLLYASMRQDFDDDSFLGASLLVAQNTVGGSIAPWREAYPDHDDVLVAGITSLRTFEESTVNAPALTDEPMHIVTWRYIVPFDPRSVLLFTFSSPNEDLREDLEAYFADIMDDVTLDRGSAPPA